MIFSGVLSTGVSFLGLRTLSFIGSRLLSYFSGILASKFLSSIFSSGLSCLSAMKLYIKSSICKLFVPEYDLISRYHELRVPQESVYDSHALMGLTYLHGIKYSVLLFSACLTVLMILGVIQFSFIPLVLCCLSFGLAHFLYVLSSKHIMLRVCEYEYQKLQEEHEKTLMEYEKMIVEYEKKVVEHEEAVNTLSKLKHTVCTQLILSKMLYKHVTDMSAINNDLARNVELQAVQLRSQRELTERYKSLFKEKAAQISTMLKSRQPDKCNDSSCIDDFMGLKLSIEQIVLLYKVFNRSVEQSSDGKKRITVSIVKEKFPQHLAFLEDRIYDIPELQSILSDKLENSRRTLRERLAILSKKELPESINGVSGISILQSFTAISEHVEGMVPAENGSYKITTLELLHRRIIAFQLEDMPQEGAALCH